MKTIKILLLSTLVAALALTTYSCREKEEIANDINIPGLGGTDEVKNELDKWLFDTYTKTYNIEVVYRWDASQMQGSITSQLVPIKAELVQPMMDIISKVWFEPYLKAAGATFLKEMAPKKIVLVGSPEYQSGAIKLGQAEGGRKILLLNANNFDPSNDAGLRQYLHTIEHEFAHILHQTKLFDKSFETISGRYYDPAGWKAVTNNDAYKLGFLRNYAMSGKDEDFAEMLSMIMVYGRGWYENTIIPIATASTVEPNAANHLRAKEEIVVDYMDKVWGIRFYDDDITGEKGLVTYVQEAITAVVAEHQGPKK